MKTYCEHHLTEVRRNVLFSKCIDVVWK